MGNENSKCGCCNSKENNEVKLDTIKDQIRLDSNENNKNNKQPCEIKDLKSYVNLKNNESFSQKEDESSSANNNNDKYVIDNNNKESNQKISNIILLKNEEKEEEKKKDDEDIVNNAIKNFEKENNNKSNSLIEKKEKKKIKTYFSQKSLSTLPDNKNGKKAYNTYSIIKIQKIFKGHY